MSTRTFILQLLGTALGTLAVLGLVSLHPPIASYWRWSIASVLLFILLSVLMYVVAKRSLDSPSKNMFTRISLLVVFFKLVVALAFVVLYDQLTEPANRWFIVPFLVVYGIFTIFELHFMIKLSRENTE